MSWLRYLPDDSALAREMDPDWTDTEHLLAGIFDLLAVANYQRTERKGAKPKPLPRPGATTTNVRHHGKTHLSREEALKILRPDTTEATEGGDDGD